MNDDYTGHDAPGSVQRNPHAGNGVKDGGYHDVIIIGAGISGLGAAWHLEHKCPNRRWLILEARNSHGGTWDLHKYPGIRSDSDLYTFGYSFKPWSGGPIANAEMILNYLAEVIEENNFATRIHYGKRVTSANWCSARAEWQLMIEDTRTGDTWSYRCNFLDLCLGYYDHHRPYIPSWPGMENFKGQMIHPQQWPENLDWTDKKIVVIGSGATAATLIPNLAEKARHVTMLQRSPTWFFAAPNDSPIVRLLNMLHLPDRLKHRIMRFVMLSLSRWMHWQAKTRPEKAGKWLLKQLEQHISRDQIDQHFTPRYRPWQQRIAFIPDGDLFQAMKAGKAGIVTDHIKTFTRTGIETQSGTKLDADIIVTATGFNLAILGDLPITVDDQPIDLSGCWSHRGIMLSGLPNLIYFFGYLRTSWTMRVDLIADYKCRLLNVMADKGVKSCTPTLPKNAEQTFDKNSFISEDEFNPGYIKRSIDQLPKSAGQYPWHFKTDYYQERLDMAKFDLEDSSLIYE